MLNWFKKIALLEGLSLLLLLFVAMPLKYLADLPIYVKYIGMTHGILFILYVIMAFLLKEEKNWNLKNFAIILVASFIPAGTFYVDKKYLS